LHREYPEPGEAILIEKMVRLTLKRMKPQKAVMRRGQHAKPTGCVRASFTILDDLPDHLRHGVFREEGKTFRAIVRFSNSSETIDPDGKGAARGMAIKLFDVEGTPAIPGTKDYCQDFLLVNHPVFPFPTPAAYVKLFEIRRMPLVGDLLAGAWLKLFHPRRFAIIKAIRDKVVASPLEISYWSGSPYWLGPMGTSGGYAIKYSAVPRLKGKAQLPDNPDQMADDYLSQAITRHLAERAAVFDFNVQLQTDPVLMPVEDVSVEWSEELSKPIPMATLTIEAQDTSSSDGQRLATECEAMAFSPWNALAEHRPIGGINRLRKEVYLASQTKRAANWRA